MNQETPGMTPSQACRWRNDIILLAHMQRLHHLMSPSLRVDLDEILRSGGWWWLDDGVATSFLRRPLKES